MKSTGKNGVPRTVEEYLASVPEPARGTLGKVRAAIRSAAPAEATEGISYRMPMFKYKGMLAGFAAFSEHCSLPYNANPAADPDCNKQRTQSLVPSSNQADNNHK